MSGRRLVLVATASGTAALAEPALANRTRPDPRSQVSVTWLPVPGMPKLAVERPAIIPQVQVPGVCGASRQSDGGLGKGGWAGAGRGATTTGRGAGADFGGVAQAPSASVITTRGKIAFTALLWEEPGR